MALAMALTNIGGSKQKEIHPFFGKRQAVLPPMSRAKSTDSTVPEFLEQTKETEEPETEDGKLNDEFRKSPLEILSGSKPGSPPRTGKDDNVESITPTQFRLVLSPSKSPKMKRQSQGTSQREVSGEEEDDRFQQTEFETDPNSGRRKRQKTESPAPPPTTGSSSTSTQLYSDPDLWRRQLEEAVRSEIEQSAPDAISSSQLNPGSPNLSSSVSENTGAEDAPSGYGKGQLPHNTVAPPDDTGCYDRIALQAPSPLRKKVSNVETPQEDRPSQPVSKTATPKKKLLRLNRNGKLLSSPPSSSAPAAVKIVKTTTRTRRSRKSDEPRHEMITVLKYGSDLNTRSSFGEKIDTIMSGSKSYSTLPSVDPPSNDPVISSKPTAAELSKPREPPKKTHPFFLDKPMKRGELTIKTSLPSVSTNTSDRDNSVSPRKHAKPSLRSPRSKSSVALYSADFSNGPPKARIANSKQPLWPPKGLTHIYENQDHIEQRPDERIALPRFDNALKAKDSVIRVSDVEDILSNTSRRLHLRSRDFSEIADSSTKQVIRLPKRYLLTGTDLQAYMANKLSCSFGSATQLEDFPGHNKGDEFKRKRAHPALKDVYGLLRSSLTAFDKAQCDILPWATKYAPKVADNVLQPGSEARILSDWLRSLIVSTVDNRSSSTLTSSRKGDPSKRRKKRQKRSDGLEDFVVSSEDEDEDRMDEVPTSEDEFAHPIGQPRKRSVIKNIDLSKAANSAEGKNRIANTVLISGPHGCGKTASVYAVAKELGFEVFEINPGSRRSGKDIFDKVGDMTQNHLVRHTRDEVLGEMISGPEATGESTKLEIETGRQGTMNKFFKPKAQPSTKSKTSKKGRARQEDKAEKPKEESRQKQSVILLEEVDILFEEDKGFWSGVLELISQSKRPIIMTCNDESLIPLDDISFHAILRFNPPPEDLAVDYLLLLAANEGHLLEREALKALYNTQNRDLRSSITELNFWCQMAIGDRKGGLEWMIDRWPPGIDCGADGQKLRVLSENTYTTGMGWLSRDRILDESVADVEVEAELLAEAWDSWGLDAIDTPEVVEPEAANTISKSLIDVFRQYEAYTSNRSTLDIVCGRHSQDLTKDCLDTTLPEMSTKTLLNYAAGYAFLQANLHIDYTNADNKLGSAIRAFSRPSWISRSTFGESNLLKAIEQQASSTTTVQSIVRSNLRTAFKPIIETPMKFEGAASSRHHSSFECPISVVAEDLAPYIRFIVASDVRLEQTRDELNKLLSQGGRSGKVRTTRASRAALEGGNKATTRKERYLPKTTSFSQVLSTGHESWQKALLPQMETEVNDGDDSGTESFPGSSAESSAHE